MNGRTIFVKISALLALIATIAVNALAQILPIGGFTTGEISDMYPTLLTPPGFTFGIWLVIYLLLTAFLILQLISPRADTLTRISPWFLGSCLCNITWMLCWHFQLIVPSMIAIAGLLICLFVMWRKTRREGVLTKVTFSTYYAWITVATMLSVLVTIKTLSGGAPITPIEGRSVAFAAAGSGFFGSTDAEYSGIILTGSTPEMTSYVTTTEYFVSCLVMALTALLAVIHLYRHSDYAYAAVVLWAIAGILFLQVVSSTPPVWLILTAIAGVAAIILAIISTISSRKQAVPVKGTERATAR